MSFGHPKVLWMGAVLLPLFILFLWATWRKRQALIGQFVRNRALAERALGGTTGPQLLRRALLLGAVTLLLLAMAAPQWGFTWEEASQRGRDIIVALDTSRSMLAADIQPNRLARAKLAALDLLALGRFDRFGLVAFAGTAFLQCPLTFDDEAFRQSVQILEPGVIPQGGTALAAAIDTAREAFGDEAKDDHRVLILFTDGEDHEAQVMEAVERAVSSGLKIFTVGVGTAAGELLRVKNESGQVDYVKNELGNVVKSSLNEGLLQQMATRGNGFYLNLQGANAMQVLYERGLAPLPTSEQSSKLMKRLKEQYYWPLAAAILLLILDVFVPGQRKPRQKNASPAAPSAPLRPATALGLALVCALSLSTVPTHAASASKARRHYQAGEFKSALSEYQELLTKSPQDPRLKFNAGAAAYQAGKFDEATRQFQSAAASPDLDLQQQSFYNLANAEFRSGEAASDLNERRALWQQAVQHYDAALKLNPSDQAAQFNRDLVQKKIDLLPKEESEEKPEKQPGDPKQDDQDSPKDPEKSPDQQDQKQDQKQDSQSSDPQKDEEKKDNSSQAGDPSEQKDPQDQAQSQPSEKNQPKDEKGEKSASQQPQAGDEKSGEEGQPQGEGGAQVAQLGKMTPEQARQLLDAQRSEEKALMFVPQERRGASRNRIIKDW